MKNVLKKWIEYQTIKRSGLFDPTYYLLHNPDVKDANPLSHFIEYGWKEGRNPSQAFDTRFYLATNPDVQKAGGNPLLHYLRFGQTEGRAKNPIEHYGLALGNYTKLATQKSGYRLVAPLR